MRLAINSGGLDSFFNGISSFVNMGANSINSNRLIDSFQTVANKTSDINGGVGTLGTALGYIKTCKVAEETRRTAVQAVKTKTDNFIQTALRVDAEVAATVNASKEEFYKTNPWLRPPAPPSNWDKFWGGVADTAKACWKGVKDFYKEHKKVIDTVLIVAGAALAIVAVICTGGLALAPLLAAGLTAVGVGAGTALTIATTASLIVAGIAVTSTIASSTLNIIDTWGEIDNPAFNTWQSVLNWTSGISNGLYSVGSIYNSVKGISNASLREYGKTWIKNPDFRKALVGADKFKFTLEPSKSLFWSGFGKGGDKVAKGVAEKIGGKTLEMKLDSNGISMPIWNNTPEVQHVWNSASASFALRSSGGVSAVLGEVGKGSVWLNIEKIILNVSPKVTSITTLTATGKVVSIAERVFRIDSLSAGIMSMSQLIGKLFDKSK